MKNYYYFSIHNQFSVTMAFEGSLALTRYLELEQAVKLDATSGSKTILVSAQDIKEGTTAICESPVII